MIREIISFFWQRTVSSARKHLDILSSSLRLSGSLKKVFFTHMIGLLNLACKFTLGKKILFL